MTKPNTERVSAPTRRSRVALLALGAALFATLLLGAGNTTARAESAREALQSYLNARLAGELETASGFWEREEMRRSRAMGMRFEQVEASYDDFWLMSTAERQLFREQHTLKITEGAAKENVAHFQVDVVAKKDPSQVKDTWRYLTTQTEAGWRVSLPLVHDSRSWTRREGRFITIRSKRLARVNSDATNAMDAHIETLFDVFATPKAARLRLERVKYEVYVIEDDADAAELLGSADRLGYLPGNERVLTTAVADFAALTNAVAALTLRKTAPASPAFFKDGLGAAWGGRAELSANVLIARTRNQVLRKKLALDLPFSDPDNQNAAAVAALWNNGLYGVLGAEEFFKLYGSLRDTPASVEKMSPKDIRGALEAATSMKGKKLEEAILAQLAKYDDNIECGCDTWPPEVPNLRSMLSWRDVESSWGMRGYATGDVYTIAIGAHRSGMPEWALNYVDSIAAANGSDAVMEREPEPERPEGDPPYFVITFGPRFDVDPEPYESQIFGSLFSSQEYLDQYHGFFVSHDMVRMYDYKTDRLIAEYDASNAAPGDPVFYDEEKGRVCFRMRMRVFGKPITHYTPRAGRYTGE